MSGATAPPTRTRARWVTEGGWEYNAVPLAALFAIAGTGPGALSLDRALGIERRGAGWAVLSVGGGALAGLADVPIAKRAAGDKELAAAA